MLSVITENIKRLVQGRSSRTATTTQKMKNSRCKAILAVLAAGLFSCALFTQQAQAVPITGQIDFTGGMNLNLPMGSATAITSFVSVTVLSNPPTTPSGSYSGLGGTSVPTFNGFSFSSFSTVSPLWSFTVSGITYSFDLTSLNPVVQGAGFFFLSGTGLAKITGFTNTAGTFSLSSQGTPGTTQFSFSATTAATNAVPDGGSAVALLGIGLAGIEAVRRRIFARNA